MYVVRSVILAAIAVLLALLLVEQRAAVEHQRLIVANQKALMRQQFQSDGAALFAVLGDSGIEKILKGSGDFTPKESFLAGSLIHRFIVIKKDIAGAYSTEELDRVDDECRALMSSPIMQEKWRNVRGWYAEDSQGVIDSCLPAASPGT